MRELVQLVLSVFFGLLPVWLIILRSRNRKRQRQMVAEAARKTPAERGAGDDTEYASSTARGVSDDADAEQLLKTDSVWGAQYFTPPSPRVPVPLTEEEAEDVSVWAQQAEVESAAYSPAAEHESATIGDDSVSMEDRFLSSEAREDAADANQTADPQSRIRRNVKAAIIVSTLKRNELRRAVILSEILAAPRALHPGGEEYH